MRVFILVFLFTIGAFGQKLEVSNFETDLYSKASKEFSKKISLSMFVTGRDVFDESYKVIDALNVVIGSFDAQFLLTSKGKEAFKKALIKYTSSKYSVEIDEIFIQRLYIVNSAKVDDIVTALRREGCCNINSSNSLDKKDNLKNSDDIIVIE